MPARLPELTLALAREERSDQGIFHPTIPPMTLPAVTEPRAKSGVVEAKAYPLFHQLFSSDPGCYDLDGVKTDFQADKIHADMPGSGPSWRGEENTFYHMYKLFYHEMKRHKPDAVHIGGAGNYWLAQFIDINRTYDVFTSNYLEHENRARMLMATTPGCPVAYDFHNFTENLEEYCQSAKKLGASIEIGNILTVKQDPFSQPQPPDQAYFDLLRKYL